MVAAGIAPLNKEIDGMIGLRLVVGMLEGTFDEDNIAEVDDMHVRGLEGTFVEWVEGITVQAVMQQGERHCLRREEVPLLLLSEMENGVEQWVDIPLGEGNGRIERAVEGGKVVDRALWHFEVSAEQEKSPMISALGRGTLASH